jgi:hypothetical protein
MFGGDGLQLAENVNDVLRTEADPRSPTREFNGVGYGAKGICGCAAGKGYRRKSASDQVVGGADGPWRRLVENVGASSADELAMKENFLTVTCKNRRDLWLIEKV